jgi:hypothetical protein
MLQPGRSFLTIPIQMLSGTIPLELQSMSNARFFGLDSNDLTGTIPSAVVERLTNVEMVTLHSNTLDGPIVSEFGLLSKLRVFSLYDNVSPLFGKNSWNRRRQFDTH